MIADMCWHVVCGATFLMFVYRAMALGFVPQDLFCRLCGDSLTPPILAKIDGTIAEVRGELEGRAAVPTELPPAGLFTPVRQVLMAYMKKVSVGGDAPHQSIVSIDMSFIRLGVLLCGAPRSLSFLSSWRRRSTGRCSTRWR